MHFAVPSMKRVKSELVAKSPPEANEPNRRDQDAKANVISAVDDVSSASWISADLADS
jgi:hypothetical protein